MEYQGGQEQKAELTIAGKRGAVSVTVGRSLECPCLCKSEKPPSVLRGRGQNKMDVCVVQL